MSRLSRLELSARLCNLGLNPDAARPFARLMSRLSRPHLQTFQTQTRDATMQFGSKSDPARPLARLMSRFSRPYVQIFQALCPDFPGLMSRLSRPYVQTYQALCPDLPDSNSRRDYANWVYIRMRREPWRDSCPNFPDLMSRLSRLKISARLCNLGLNPDAAQRLARLMSILSRPYV